MTSATIKSIFRAVAVTATLALALPVFGQAIQTRVTIPVAFELGHDSMPAGHYILQRAFGTGQMFITDPAGVQRAFMTLPVGGTQSPYDGKLVFEKMGHTYRLAEVYLIGAPNGVRIPATKSQVEMAKQQKPDRLEVAMVRR